MNEYLTTTKIIMAIRR